MSNPLSIAGVTLTPNPQGVALSYGWFNNQISTADVETIRDWLNLNFQSPVLLGSALKPSPVPPQPSQPPSNDLLIAFAALSLQLSNMEQRVMSGLSDLQAAEASLAAVVATETANIQAAATANANAITGLQGLLTQIQAGGDSDATVESAAQAVNAAIATLQANQTTLTTATGNLNTAVAAIPAAPAPAPAPVPAGS